MSDDCSSSNWRFQIGLLCAFIRFVATLNELDARQALLKLPPDALTKHIQLAEDLLELFIKYQVAVFALSNRGAVDMLTLPCEIDSGRSAVVRRQRQRRRHFQSRRCALQASICAFVLCSESIAIAAVQTHVDGVKQMVRAFAWISSIVHFLMWLVRLKRHKIWS